MLLDPGAGLRCFAHAPCVRALALEQIYAYVGQALGICDQLKGHEDKFNGNKVVLTGAKVGWFRCSPVDDYAATVLHDNEYFTADGNVSECGVPLQQWQTKGGDQRSTVALLPKDDVIIAWAKVALGF